VSSMGFKEIGYYKADTLAANILDISFKDWCTNLHFTGMLVFN
jgi:hypothetical protein